MPVTLRLNLFDRQAGYYYINGAKEMKWLVLVSRQPPVVFSDVLIYLS